MKLQNLLLLALVALACSKANKGEPVDVPMLTENIKAFVNAKKCFHESRQILIVILAEKNDTLYLDIADTYPNIKTSTFAYDTTIYGVRALFLGKKIKGFSTNLTNQSFPLDIIEINKNQKWLLQRESTNWYFVYHNGTLIRKSLGCDAETLAH